MNMSGVGNQEGGDSAESNNNNIIIINVSDDADNDNNNTANAADYVSTERKNKQEEDNGEIQQQQVGDVVPSTAAGEEENGNVNAGAGAGAGAEVDVANANANANAEENKPPLPDGFYELEAIRSKRICSGKPMYFVKWRGWPEDANTWEPLKNLEGCKLLIKDFEKRWRSRKSSGTRKRKPNSSYSKSKLKPPRSAADFQNTLGALAPSSSAPPANSNEHIDDSAPLQPTGHSVPMHPISIRSENNEDVNNTNGSQQNDDSQEETESDPRVSELRKTLYAEDHLKTGADQRVTELRKTMSSGELNSLGKGTAKVDRAASGSSTLTGAKRRKIGNPGRWPQVSPSPAAGNEPGFVADSIGANGQIGAETPNSVQSSRSPRNNADAVAIVKINKPNTIMTTTKNGTPSIRLMFSVERVDGTEVTVSNEFLKDCFPELLFQYYEGHLKYAS